MDAEKFLAVYGESRNGCNNYIRHPLSRRFIYTDGVQELAETGCYWLLDLLARELPAVFKANPDEAIGYVKVTVTKTEKVKITLEFSGQPEGTASWTKRIGYTDMPAGEYSFEVGLNADPERDGEVLIMCLMSEH